MLNHYIDIKNQINKITSSCEEKYIKDFLIQLYNYVDKIISIIRADAIQKDNFNMLLEQYLNEITNFLTIYKNSKRYIEIKDIKFSIKIIQGIQQELDKMIQYLNQAEITDVNAEMKLLENILKEDGYLKDFNK